jgi:hypothetical protein
VDREIRADHAQAALRLAAAIGAALEDAHPDVGDIGAPFEAIVALDTDRAGLLRLAREQGVELEGCSAGSARGRGRRTSSATR